MAKKSRKLPRRFFRRKVRGNYSTFVYFRISRGNAVSTGLTDPTDSELFHWLVRWEEAQAHSKSGYETWPAERLFPLFLEAKLSQRRRPAPSTLENYERAKKHLATEKWWTSMPLREVNTDIALAYMAKRRDGTHEPERDIRFLKQLKRWCIKTEKFDAREICVSTPVGTDLADPVGRCISIDEEERLRNAIRSGRSHTGVWMFELTIVRGFRQQEVQKLKVSWIDWQEKMIMLPGEYTKTRQPREVPIPEHLIFPLKSLCQGKGPDDGVFTTRNITPDDRMLLGCWWALAKQRAGVKCRFHDLRVTCCTRMAEAGVPQAYAEDILGHDEEVRKIYVKILSRTKKRDVMKDFDQVCHTECHTFGGKTSQPDAAPRSAVQIDEKPASTTR